MSIHPPKVITSAEGLGLNTHKEMLFITPDLGISTERWGKMPQVWQESGIVIADEGYQWRTRWEVGTPYIVTKLFDAAATLVGIYCDISRPVQRIESGFTFEDLYLDVWQTPNNQAVILDEDELQEALKANLITEQEALGAQKIAQQVQRQLDTDPNFTNF
ncbi:MAG: DUF402 domain-containing protein [Candidatus Saccharimonadales bacterium]